MNDDEVARRLLDAAGLLDPTPEELRTRDKGRTSVETAISIVNMFPDSAIPTFGIAVPRIVQSTLKELREVGISGKVERLVDAEMGGSDEARALHDHITRTLAIAVISIILMSDTVGLAFDTSPDAPGQEGG